MTVDLMDYEALVRDAYRLIVRKVLIRVAKPACRAITIFMLRSISMRLVWKCRIIYTRAFPMK